MKGGRDFTSQEGSAPAAHRRGGRRLGSDRSVPGRVRGSGRPGGSWMNMAESLQRTLKHRAVDGQTPDAPNQIMAWFEAVAEH